MHFPCVCTVIQARVSAFIKQWMDSQDNSLLPMLMGEITALRSQPEDLSMALGQSAVRTGESRKQGTVPAVILSSKVFLFSMPICNPLGGSILHRNVVDVATSLFPL